MRYVIERRPDDDREGDLAQAASHLHAAARALSFGLAQAATFVLEVLGDSDDDIIADEFNTNAPRMLYAIRKVLEVPLMTGMGLPLGIRERIAAVAVRLHIVEYLASNDFGDDWVRAAVAFLAATRPAERGGAEGPATEH